MCRNSSVFGVCVCDRVCVLGVGGLLWFKRDPQSEEWMSTGSVPMRVHKAGLLEQPGVVVPLIFLYCDLYCTVLYTVRAAGMEQ